VKDVPRWGGYTVNLLHYEDAASLAVAALGAGPASRGRAYIGADGAPVTFQARARAAAAARPPACWLLRPQPRPALWHAHMSADRLALAAPFSFAAPFQPSSLTHSLTKPRPNKRTSVQSGHDGGLHLLGRLQRRI
jgi:nucleoside-diphosphate-sugar epimerase